jgi:putative ABC transport system permease protein
VTITTAELVRAVIGVAVLLAITYAVLRVATVRLGWAPLIAIVRGGIQLAFVGLALRGVLNAPSTVAIALVVMLSAASWTAASRLRGFGRVLGKVTLVCSVGSAVSLVTVFALDVLPFSSRYVVALSGIVIGNSMTGATLAGRHLLAGMISRREEIEGWLALGATSRQAVRDVARSAAGEALVPVIDQTRTTGLVTLPGAFIGALLGGADPTQAARFQLVVLAAILASQAVVSTLIVHLLGAPTQLPADPAMREVH